MQSDPVVLSWLAPCLVLVAYLLLPGVGQGLDRAWTVAARRLHRGWTVRVALAVATVALCASVTAVHGVPLPYVHDELSNLLQADTFARFRLTNPTHRHWEFFEGFHIIHQPSYASKYPPGTAVLLALGQAGFGAPIVGVWLGSAAAAAAIHWMLQGICGRRWALVGASLFLCRIGAGSYFGHSYWGGSLAVLGGALVFGAVQRRVAGMPGALGHGAWLGIGLVLLANTRPYEGLVAGLGAAVWLLTVLRRRGFELPAMAVTGAILALGAGLVLTFNQAVTGDGWVLPYQVHDKTYHEAPVFVVQDLRPAKVYRHEIMRRYHQSEVAHYREQRTAPGALGMVARTVNGIRRFYLGEVLSWLLVLLPWVVLRRRSRGALLWLTLGTGAVCLANWFWPHYFAPFAGWVSVLVVVLLRELRRVGRSGRVGRAGQVGRGATGRALTGWVVLGAMVAGLASTPRNSQVGWPRRRAAMATELQTDGGQHLVFVRDDPEAGFHADWVFNGADIDGQAVVWARDLGPARNRELIDYFAGRAVWVLDRPQVDPTARPRPYPGVTR